MMNRSAHADARPHGWMLVIALLGWAWVSPSPVVAQAGSGDGEVDLVAAAADAWTVRRDQGSRGDPPRVIADGESLAVKTGASTILYRPDTRAEGDYTLNLTFTQFDPGRRNEGYGIVLGGNALDGPAQTYTYLLIRQDGFALLKRRDGERTPIVRDWFEVPSLRTWASRDEGSDQISNAVGIDIHGGRITVRFNGVEALDAELPAAETSGLLGLRVNHGLDVRVDEFVLTKHGSN